MFRIATTPSILSIREAPLQHDLVKHILEYAEAEHSDTISHGRNVAR
jgi:hypothetical protein